MNWDIKSLALSDEEKAKIESIFAPYAPLKHDPWGASLESILGIAPLIFIRKILSCFCDQP